MLFNPFALLLVAENDVTTYCGHEADTARIKDRKKTSLILF